MEYRWKKYMKNGRTEFCASPAFGVGNNVNLALEILKTDDEIEKIDIYEDSKLKATVYG